jgi:DNA primase
VRLEFRSFVRQIKMDMLKNELKTLFSSGLTSDQMGIRYREINALQDQLIREAQEEMAPR